MDDKDEKKSTPSKNWGDVPPDNTQDEPELKLYHIRHVRITGEYCSGIIAGFGLGIVVASSSCCQSIPSFVGFGLIALGSAIGYRIQQERAMNRKEQNNRQ